MPHAPDAHNATPPALTQACWLRWQAFAATHPALPGHFPGRPVIPGVMLLECVQELLNECQPAWVLHGLPTVKFLRPALPEIPLLICVEFTTLEPTPITGRITGRFTCRSAGAPAPLLAQGNFVLHPAQVAPA